jgi:DNA-directed RNA polymerase subunit RPC12/RpoP
MKIYTAYIVFSNCDKEYKLGVTLTYDNAKGLIESSAQEENKTRNEEKELKKYKWSNYFYLNGDIKYHIETDEIYDDADFTEISSIDTFSLNRIDYVEVQCSKCYESFILKSDSENFERCPYCSRLII